MENTGEHNSCGCCQPKKIGIVSRENLLKFFAEKQVDRIERQKLTYDDAWPKIIIPQHDCLFTIECEVNYILEELNTIFSETFMERVRTDYQKLFTKNKITNETSEGSKKRKLICIIDNVIEDMQKEIFS